MREKYKVVSEAIKEKVIKCIESDSFYEYYKILHPNKGDASCPFRGEFVTISVTEEWEGLFRKRIKESKESKYLCLKRRDA